MTLGRNGRRADGPLERLANEAFDGAKDRVVDELVLLLASLRDAGPGGLELGTVREPHRGCAIALLDAVGVVEAVRPRRLRLTVPALGWLAGTPTGN